MKALLCLASFLFIVIVIGNTVIVAQTDMKAPVAKKVPKVLKIHGYEIKSVDLKVPDLDK